MTTTQKTPPGQAGQAGCRLCGGGCAGADLGPLLTPQLRWLWDRVAATADRRGDPHLRSGTLTVTAPAGAEERSAAVGLLGGRPLGARRTRRVDLAELNTKLQARGTGVSPGVVAAHATGRELAAKARRREAQSRLEDRLVTQLLTSPALRTRDAASLVADVRRAGWLTRVQRDPDPEALVARTLQVLTALPRDASAVRVDRRRLADATLDDPHGLDDGQPVAASLLGLLRALGRVPAGVPTRQAWAQVGVDYDNLTGGLIVTGVTPTGWTVPAGVSLTLPPRELDKCQWSAPPGEGEAQQAPPVVFVTENPSVLAEVLDAYAAASTWTSTPRLVCTSGTPSGAEIRALGRLAAAGWNLLVRADFDEAGLRHVRALLDGIPTARPWRMGECDYRLSVRRSPNAPSAQLPGPPVAHASSLTPWDPALEAAMRSEGRVASEESLLEELVADVRASADR